MSDFFIYYVESNIVCIIIFGIMLAHDLFGVDRQEKQIKFDRALMSYMLYFVSDSFWAAVVEGLIPATRFTLVFVNFLNYIFMAAITLSWLEYAMAFEQVPHRNNRRTQLALAFPFLVSTIAITAAYFIDPGSLIDSSGQPTPLYNAFQVFVPYIYIAAVLIYTIRRAVNEKSSYERKQHLYIGAFPLLVVAGGLLQMIVLPEVPVFCFCCAILMLIFYIQSMDSQISIDPLTGLNNRGQILRYISLEGSRHRDSRHTYAAMLDVNDFKEINDTYGHAEGDKALVLIAKALKNAGSESETPVFIGRYGGDEFVLIAYPSDENGMKVLIELIRKKLAEACRGQSLPYELTISAGYDELHKIDDSFKDCLKRADEKMYEDKQRQKALKTQPVP